MGAAAIRKILKYHKNRLEDDLPSVFCCVNLLWLVRTVWTKGLDKHEAAYERRETGSGAGCRSLLNFKTDIIDMQLAATMAAGGT
jgi:hypothetical protein